MTIEQALPFVLAAISVATFFIGRGSARKSEGVQDGTILTELGYIKSGVEDIKKKQAEQDKQHLEVVTRLSAVEVSARQAHHRIDEIRERCCGD